MLYLKFVCFELLLLCKLMLYQPNEMEQLSDPEQNFNFNQQTQTIIASTAHEIDELSDVAISQLANQFENKIKTGFSTEKSLVTNLTSDKSEQLLSIAVKQTLSILIQVNSHLTLLLQLYLKEKSSNTVLKEIEQDTKKFRKSILLFQSQMSMILWVQLNIKKTHFKQKYFKKFHELQQFSIQINNLQDTSINCKTVTEALNTSKQILHQYIDSIVELKRFIQKKKRPKYLFKGLNRLYVINAKILTISEILPYCCTVPKDDLFCYDLDHPRWRKLTSQSIVYRSFGSKQTLKKSFNHLKTIVSNFQLKINLINATMGILDKTRKLPLLKIKSWLQIARSSKEFMKIFLFKEAAKKQAQYMVSSANTKLMKEVWNLPEHKIFRDFAEFILPSIEHSQRLYIPRIAIDYFNSNGLNFPQTKIVYLYKYGNQLFQKKSYENSLRIRINSKFKLTPKFNIIDEKVKSSSQGTGIIVQKVQQAIFKIGTLYADQKKYVPDKLVFHIHGGGFISMSSFTHQVYVRTWTKQLQVPFISVDYGKAPEHPYPQSLYDCVQAYIWTLHCFQQVYDIKPKKIIFLGDSAGGNLAAALINLCIAWKLRVPDGLVMCYPVLKVSSKYYTKSLLGTLEDMILPHTILKLCAQSYVSKEQKEEDPLINPLDSPKQFLSKFPPTRIFVGSKDPFHDDCCRFTQKINSANPGKCLLTVFEQFPHGFLQFDLKTNPNEFGRRANEQICKNIKQMFEQLVIKSNEFGRARTIL